MEENCINIKFNIPELNSYFKLSELSPNIHHAHLITENSPERTISLKVFYEDKNLLGRKVSTWLHSSSNSFSHLGEKIEVTQINNNENLKEIDFSNSKLEKVSNSTAFYEGQMRYFLLIFDSVRKVHAPRFSKEEEKETYFAEFYLNEGSRKLIEYLYAYLDLSHSWKAINRKNKFYKFGDIRLKLDYHFYSKQHESTSTVHREPRLTIEHKNLSEEEVLRYGNLILSIMTLYRNEVVDFEFARIHNKNHTITITKKDYEIITLKHSHIKELGFRGDIIDLLRKIKPEKILEKTDFYRKFTKRYALGSKMQGESKFMILYNLLEQIRNAYIDPKTLKQTYTFKPNKKDTNKFINEALTSISGIVDDSEKRKFKSNVTNHCRTIKYLPMKNQFDGLFKLLRLNLQERGLNFLDLKKMRDKIFHGQSIDFNNQELKDANKELIKLVGIILLKLAGVNK